MRKEGKKNKKQEQKANDELILLFLYHFHLGCFGGSLLHSSLFGCHAVPLRDMTKDRCHTVFQTQANLRKQYLTSSSIIQPSSVGVNCVDVSQICQVHSYQRREKRIKLFDWYPSLHSKWLRAGFGRW